MADPSAGAGAGSAAAAPAETTADGARRVVKIGSRESVLARWQADHVQALLSAAHPDIDFVVETSSSPGDADQSKPLAVLAAANPGLFTKDLETRLQAKEVHLIVHSLKDMPTTLPDGLVLAAITEREDPEDVLVVRAGSECKTIADLPPGAVVGTSSLRRAAVLAGLRKDVHVHPIRGNLNTRLRKLDEGTDVRTYEAIILARAGVLRMGWEHRITAVLSSEEFPYSVGQGALGVECREDDPDTQALVQAAVHEPTSRRCRAERAFLRGLQGGCQVPIGVRSSVDDDGTLHLTGVVLSMDGKPKIQVEGSNAADASPEALGACLAEEALKAGAAEMIAEGVRPISYGSA